MEKCSDGKRAKSVGNLKGKWDARYVVMTKVGLWWYKTQEDFDGQEAPSGYLLELPSAEINVRLSQGIFLCVRPARVFCLCAYARI